MIILFLLIAGNAFILNLVLPWWSVVLPGLFCYRMHENQSGLLELVFSGIFGMGCTSVIHIASAGVLSARIAELFGLMQDWILIVITAVIGGILSFATLTSSLLAQSRNKNTVSLDAISLSHYLNEIAI